MTSTERLEGVLLSLGTGWILGALGLLSAASIALFVERLLAYRASRADVQQLALWLDERLERGEQAEAIARLRGSKAVAARIAAAGLRLAWRGPAAAKEAMASASALERSRLQARVAWLGTIGNNAPFLGLFGTVVGIIHAFEVLSTGTAGATGSASRAVMGAVAEALVATAVGIGVALPAVAAFNFLQRRLSEILAEAEALSSLVLAYLSTTVEKER